MCTNGIIVNYSLPSGVMFDPNKNKMASENLCLLSVSASEFLRIQDDTVPGILKKSSKLLILNFQFKWNENVDWKMKLFYKQTFHLGCLYEQCQKSILLNCD